MPTLQSEATAAFLKHGIDMNPALVEHLNEFHKRQFEARMQAKFAPDNCKQLTDLDEPKVELPPDTVPRLELEPADYIDELAQAITTGTKLPFSFARETYKMMFLASLTHPPALPWFSTLHARQYLIVVSDTPSTGKGETFRRCRRTLERAIRRPAETETFTVKKKDEQGKTIRVEETHNYPALSFFPVEFIAGSSIGSPQWACVRLGGERWTAKKPRTGRVFIDSDGQRKEDAGGLTVSLPIRGRIVHYDEGKMLFQHDAVGKGERGLITMFTALFESNAHSMGSCVRQLDLAHFDHLIWPPQPIVVSIR